MTMHEARVADDMLYFGETGTALAVHASSIFAEHERA